MSAKTLELTEQQIKNAASRLGQVSWQRLQENFSEEELHKRQSDAGKLGGRPRKDS